MSNRLSLVPAVYLFLEKDGKYLFLRRANSGYYDGHYQVPSGHIEAGETSREAMVREAKEEVGIDLDIDDLQFVNAVYRMDGERTGYRVDFCFLATTWQGEVTNAEPGKCDDIQWFSPDELPENTVPLMHTVLDAIRARRYLSETIDA